MTEFGMMMDQWKWARSSAKNDVEAVDFPPWTTTDRICMRLTAIHDHAILLGAKIGSLVNKHLDDPKMTAEKHRIPVKGDLVYSQFVPADGKRNSQDIRSHTLFGESQSIANR